jgi:hypothetical protein
MAETETERSFAERIDQLRTVRDELRVRLNLAGKEARDQFQAAERAWARLEGRAKRVEGESRKELQAVGAAARALAEEIQGAYHRIRDLL